jgi:hypothetical protein
LRESLAPEVERKAAPERPVWVAAREQAEAR